MTEPTNEEIELFSAVATEAGDIVAAAICQKALTGDASSYAEFPLGLVDRTLVDVMTQGEARQACAKLIGASELEDEQAHAQLRMHMAIAATTFAQRHALRDAFARRSGPEIDPDAQCLEHGCARWVCDVDHPQEPSAAELAISVGTLELRADLERLEAESAQLQSNMVQLESENARLLVECDQLKAEVEQLKRMLMAGEEIGTCEFVFDDPDLGVQPCPKPAAFLLVDASGLRCPVCADHQDANLDDVVKLAVKASATLRLVGHG